MATKRTNPQTLLTEARKAKPKATVPPKWNGTPKWKRYGETIHELRQRGMTWRDIKAWLGKRGHLISVQGAVNAEALWLRSERQANSVQRRQS